MTSGLSLLLEVKYSLQESVITNGEKAVKKRKVDIEDTSAFDGKFTNEYCEKLLNTLRILLPHDVMQHESSVNGENVGVHFLQLFDKIIKARVAVKHYTSPAKSKLITHLDATISVLFFSYKTMTDYDEFLGGIVLEDTKNVLHNPTIGTTLDMLSKIMSKEVEYDSENTELCMNVFFKIFLDRSNQHETRLNMLITLAHIAGVSVPGFAIMDENLFFAKVSVEKLKCRRSELIVSSLLSVLKEHIESKDKLIRLPLFQPYIFSLLKCLCEKYVTSHYGFQAVRSILQLYPMKFRSQLPYVLGSLAVAKKPDEVSLCTYSATMKDILTPYSQMLQIEKFVVSFMKGLEKYANCIKTPERIMYPLFGKDGSSKGISYVFLSKDFVFELQKSISLIEPMQYCALLTNVAQVWKTTTDPLLTSECQKEGNILRI